MTDIVERLQADDLIEDRGLEIYRRKLLCLDAAAEIERLRDLTDDKDAIDLRWEKEKYALTIKLQRAESVIEAVREWRSEQMPYDLGGLSAKSREILLGDLDPAERKMFDAINAYDSEPTDSEASG